MRIHPMKTSRRTEGEIKADAGIILDRLESSLARAQDGLAIVDAADLAAAIDALRGLVGDVIDRHRVKFGRMEVLAPDPFGIPEDPSSSEETRAKAGQGSLSLCSC